MNFGAEFLGPDAVGRGAELWRKTNVAIRCSQVLHDLAVTEGIGPGELLGGMTETIISFLQATNGPHAWREAGAAVSAEINRRMRVR